MSDLDAVHVGRHTKLYWAIGSALFVLTLATVAASLFDVNVLIAIAIGLAIAAAKGSLVALFFMHLSHERQLIYGILMLTAIFFLVLLFLPLYGRLDSYAAGPIYVP